MAIYDGVEHHYDEDEIPELDSYPAGVNHEDLLLCGPENDTQWLMSDTFDDLKEWL